MKPAATFLIMISLLLGCERKVVNLEDQARNSVMGWLKANTPELLNNIDKVRTVQQTGDEVLVMVDTLYPGSGLGEATFCFLVQSDGGSFEVQAPDGLAEDSESEGRLKEWYGPKEKISNRERRKRWRDQQREDKAKQSLNSD